MEHQTSHDSYRSDFSIASLRAVLLSASYAPHEYLQWVGGTIRSWDAALVEVTLSDGVTGIGEAGAGIMAATAVPGTVAALLPYLDGHGFRHPLEVGDHLRRHTAFWARGGISSGTVGAIETACLDAVAKRAGVPAFTLLGELQRDTIECYASGGLGSSFDEVRAWAHAQHDLGFETIKFRAMRDATTTIELLDFVVPHLPKSMRFVLDAVQGCASDPWHLDDVLRVGRAAESYGARWYEEPCHADDEHGYAAVRKQLSVPTSGVESFASTRDFERLLAAEGVDIVQPDVTFVGGPAAFLAVATTASHANVACIPHVWGSGVTMAANLHTALVHPNVQTFEYCTLPNPLREALLIEPILRTGSRIAVPAGPGLGVELTSAIEARFPFTPGGGHVIR